MGLEQYVPMEDLNCIVLLDGRVGGDVYNGTARSPLYTDAQIVENYRNREVVVKGLVAHPDGNLCTKQQAYHFESDQP